VDVDKLKAILEALQGTEVTRLTWVSGQETLDLRLGHPPPVTTAVHALPSLLRSLNPSTPGASTGACQRGHGGGRCRAGGVQGVQRAEDVYRQLALRGDLLPLRVPGHPGLRDVGQVVKKGQVLCIVEAMKLMKRDRGGSAWRLVEALVENGSPVEYGEAALPVRAGLVFHRILIANRGEIRAAGHPRGARAGRGDRRSPLHRGRELAARPLRGSIDLHRSAAVEGELPQHSRHPLRCGGQRCRRESILATDSSARMRSSPRWSSTPGWGGSGPRPEMIRMMGNKIRAKEAMKEAGLPQLPGSDGVVHDERELVRLAERIGFPVILKAAAGGGGRGMKIVREKEQLSPMYRTASAEALAAFGTARCTSSGNVERPRHIEIQIVADEHGNVIHLGERECSVQRRHQKMLEESPSPALNDKLRERMGRHRGRGDEEDPLQQRGDRRVPPRRARRLLLQMEMNTRIQVEHPVTESVTGLDLIKEQIRLAADEELGRTQKSIVMKGHAIECRVNAEDPVSFAPSPGLITAYNPPGGLGVRIDSAAYEQYRVLPYYDSMVAKLIVYADSRPAAIMRMRRALEEYIVEGIKTNIPFHKKFADVRAVRTR